MDWEAFAVGAGTILAGVAGVMSSRAAILRARHEGSEECEEHLDAERLAREQQARALHWWRIHHPDEVEP